MANGAQGERRLHLRHAGQCRQIAAVDACEIIGVICHNLKKIIRTASHQVTFEDIWHAGDGPFEGIKHFVGLARQGDFDEDSRRAADFALIKQSNVAANDAFRLKSLNAAVAGRGGKVHLFRQFGVRHATMALQGIKEAGICGVDGHARWILLYMIEKSMEFCKSASFDSINSQEIPQGRADTVQ